MQIFGLIILTKKQMKVKERKIELEARNIMAEVLKDSQEFLDKYRKELKEREVELHKLEQRMWKEIEEAKADLILREMAKVMGGHWNGVRI